MTITVHSLSEDRDISEGLSGNYDGIADNDLTQRGLPYPAYSPEPIQFAAYFLWDYMFTIIRPLSDTVPLWSGSL